MSRLPLKRSHRTLRCQRISELFLLQFIVIDLRSGHFCTVKSTQLSSSGTQQRQIQRQVQYVPVAEQRPGDGGMHS
jgi:hypothetical protein